jgi:hypothetical protein
VQAVNEIAERLTDGGFSFQQPVPGSAEIVARQPTTALENSISELDHVIKARTALFEVCQ